MDEHNGHIRAHVLGYWEIKQEELIKWGRGGGHFSIPRLFIQEQIHVYKRNVQRTTDYSHYGKKTPVTVSEWTNTTVISRPTY